MTTANEKYVDYLDFSELSWRRPEGPTRVWRVVNGRKTSDGEIPKFCIQEVPEGMEDEVIDFLVTYLFAEEPVQVDLGTSRDPLAIREFRTLWKDIVVNQGISIVAFKMNSNPNIKPVIVGVNLLNILTVDDDPHFERLTQFRSKAMKKAMSVQLKLMDEANVPGKYGVDKYLTSLGLCVHPSARGQGLGEELLRIRDDIGLAYRIPVSETIFTATASQILAARVGFEVILERKYSELLDEEGNVAFPGVAVKFMKVMGKRLY